MDLIMIIVPIFIFAVFTLLCGLIIMVLCKACLDTCFGNGKSINAVEQGDSRNNHVETVRAPGLFVHEGESSNMSVCGKNDGRPCVGDSGTICGGGGDTGGSCGGGDSGGDTCGGGCSDPCGGGGGDTGGGGGDSGGSNDTSGV